MLVIDTVILFFVFAATVFVGAFNFEFWSEKVLDHLRVWRRKGGVVTQQGYEGMEAYTWWLQLFLFIYYSSSFLNATFFTWFQAINPPVNMTIVITFYALWGVAVVIFEKLWHYFYFETPNYLAGIGLFVFQTGALIAAWIVSLSNFMTDYDVNATNWQWIVHIIMAGGDNVF